VQLVYDGNPATFTTEGARMSTSLKLGPLLLAAVTAVCLSPSRASASLVYLGTTTQLGSGLGNVNTLVSLSPQGNGTVACGSVAPGNVTAACNGTSVTFAGGSNNQVYTIGALGVTDANDLRFVFNINEPDDSVTLTSLAINFFAPGSTATSAPFHVASYPPGAPVTLPEVGGGIGGQGHVFGLTADEAAIVNARLAAGVIIGAQFAVSGAAGGFETLNVSSVEDETPGTPSDVPEPTALMLLGSTLLGLGLASRRRQ
jgi:hypothetical protein